MTTARALATVRQHPAFGRIIRVPFRLLQRVGVSLPRRVYQHLWFHGEVRVSVPSGGSFRMHCYGDLIENEYYWGGVFAHEGECVEPWIRLARSSSVVLDIGANTGAYTLLACAANPQVTVHAFEPVERIAVRTKRNVASNPGFRATVHQVAVGAESGTAQLSDPGGSNCYSASLDPGFLGGAQHRYEVRVVAVDDIVLAEKMSSVDLVKIDVEGFEEHVLDGMRLTIARHRPALLLEYLSRPRDPLRERIARLSVDEGYVLLHLTPEGPRRAGDLSPSEQSRNVLVLPRERAPVEWLGA